jgi:hypothetical protein
MLLADRVAALARRVTFVATFVATFVDFTAALKYYPEGNFVVTRLSRRTSHVD